MKSLLVTLALCLSFSARAEVNPKASHLMKRSIASDKSGLVGCEHKLEQFVKANYELILGAGNVREVVWLVGELTTGSNSNRYLYELSVKSKGFKSSGEYDMFDYAARVIVDSRCNPKEVKFLTAKEYVGEE